MKKVLTILGLIAILTMTTPVMAHDGHYRHAHRHGNCIHAGHHYRKHVTHHHIHHVRPHHGVTIHSGYHPRHRYRSSYGADCWGSNWCNRRLGWCDDFYTPCGSFGGFGVSIRF